VPLEISSGSSTGNGPVNKTGILVGGPALVKTDTLLNPRHRVGPLQDGPGRAVVGAEGRTSGDTDASIGMSIARRVVVSHQEVMVQGAGLC
jgi:hypothetical protein